MKNDIKVAKNDIFLTIYIFLTLYLGTSVKSFLRLPGIDEGALFCFHYIALPFLLISIIKHSSVKLLTVEKIAIVLSFVFFLINRVGFSRSATFGMCINILYEPVMLLMILRIGKYSKQSLKNILICFFLIECLVGIYEAFSQSVVFMRGRDIFSLGEFGVISIRAFSLHGHPLQNAFIVSLISVALLFSNMKIVYRYSLFIIGLFAIFSFNTRSSFLFMVLAFCVRVFFDFKHSFLKYSVFFTFIILPFIYYSFNYFINNGLGDRFFILIDKYDGSSVARFMLIDMFMNMDISDIVWGIDVSRLQASMKSLGLVAIENSFLNVVFSWGIIFGCVFFICLCKMFWSIKVDNKLFYIFMLVFILLLNVNNAIQSETPIIPISFLVLYAFQLNNNNQKSIERAKN